LIAINQSRDDYRDSISLVVLEPGGLTLLLLLCHLNCDPYYQLVQRFDIAASLDYGRKRIFYERDSGFRAAGIYASL